MSHDAARQYVNEAAEAIRVGQHRQALELLGRSIKLEATNSEALVLQGIAFSALGEIPEATTSFQTAIGLAPHNAKAFYNFAVHLFGVGDTSSALEMAREAVRIDPMHGQARSLAARIERETGAGPMDLPPAMAPIEHEEISTQELSEEYVASLPTSGKYFRDLGSDYETPVHSILFIERMGMGWDLIGWILALVGAACFALVLFSFLRQASPGVAAMIHANPFDQNSVRPKLMTYATQVLLVSQVILLIWTCFDLIDRRSNWLWLFPWVMSCCCLLTWFTHMLYMLTGRSRR